MPNTQVIIVVRSGVAFAKQVPSGVTLVIKDEDSGGEEIINGPYYEEV